MTAHSGERLLHHTSTPLVEVRSEEQTGTRSEYAKPKGLWLSVEGDDDWQAWCEAEDFSDPTSQLCYEITLAPYAQVLRLTNAIGILAFTDEYGCDPYMGAMAGRTVMFGHGIQWAEVAAKHDGIIIAPYCWTLRLDARTPWYYGWDCASGCIWNARAVASIRTASPRAASVPAPDTGET